VLFLFHGEESLCVGEVKLTGAATVILFNALFFAAKRSTLAQAVTLLARF
jgi:hypothetical protein